MRTQNTSPGPGIHPRTIGGTLLLILALSLGACASAPPLQPKTPLGIKIPDQWRAAETESTGEIDTAWWQDFEDPHLTDLVAEVLENNFDLAAAAARLEQAEARARIAGAALRPQLDASVSARRNRQNFIGFPIPGSEQQVLSTTSSNLGVSLNAVWEPDLWGRLRAGEAAALADLGAAQAELAAARLSLAGQAAKVWFTAQEGRRQVALAHRTLDSRRRTTQRIERRYEQGLRPPVDLRLARANEASAEAALHRRERALDDTLRQLELLRGRYPQIGAGTEAAAETPDLPPPDPVPAGLPAELVTRRPDLAAAERRLTASGQRVREARKALYPSLRLTGSTGTTSEQIGDLLDGDFSVWSVAGSLLQPLFQGGRLRAGVALAEASEDEALARYAASVLAAFAEVESALAAEDYLEDLESALVEATAEAQAAEELAEDRYLAGLAEYLTVLESQRQSFTAESQLLEARRERLLARVDLYLALGGGFNLSSLEGAKP